jgi:hypothetical protein
VNTIENTEDLVNPEQDKGFTNMSANKVQGNSGLYQVSQYVYSGASDQLSPHSFAIGVDSNGKEFKVPTFISGDGKIRCRVKGPQSAWKSITDSAGIHFTFEKHWEFSTIPVSKSEGSRILKSSDGAPYLWLGDTVWFGLTDRITDAEWQSVMEKRKKQGFNVVQVVSGLLPEANFGEKSTLLDGVTSWTLDKSSLQVKWWDAADTRVIQAVKSGLNPALVGAWSYYILQFGAEKLKTHWTEMVARWGAFPVFWCIVGEIGLMEYENLFAENSQEEARRIQGLWKEVITHVRELDPWERPITVHPCPAFNESSFEALQGDSQIDFIWLQTGHADINVVPSTLKALDKALHDSRLPVINSEVCYEGIAGGSPALLQRYLFWTHLLHGAAGHTYGAQGLWAFHDDETSPGAMWGWIPWQQALELDGSRQLGMAAEFLRSINWDGFTPSPNSLNLTGNPESPFRPWAAKSGENLVVYFPAICMAPASIGISVELSNVKFQNLLSNQHYHLKIIDPRTGKLTREEKITTDQNGEWLFKGSNFVSPLPTMEDWIVNVKIANE